MDLEPAPKPTPGSPMKPDPEPPSWQRALGLLFLVSGSALAIHLAITDVFAFVLLVTAYVTQLLIFCYLLARTPQYYVEGERFGAAVLSLVTALTTLFSNRIGTYVPLVLSLFVQLLVCFSTVAISFAFFYCRYRIRVAE